ncbi:RagB/SusD family nutrient uptake outer membrane protein [Chryseosolibacter indicus]|uniref:RagB/SusD family nutrient uptake outer membrane protein n=1 Tax=Chryseosolibacter indicus TaxID=2782351 RepID=A0ABS5VTC2_9BACT|nr:RagB/SusD family nutrient uptake outer membrane protein [Chryseosolibacter indicus]MBT1704456.1 RagB/SusD family nutrient uptake outer membrane protein [Chryseosolibacter indicus]
MKNYKTIFNRIASKLLLTSAAVYGFSCEVFIDVDTPKTEIISQTVFTSDASAMSAVRGIYSLMASNLSFTKGGIEELTGIACDELVNYAVRPDQVQFYQNSLTSINSDVNGIFWKEAFKYIVNANAILEGLNIATGMTSRGKRVVEGEAKFIRAFCYFYLVNLFGDVPYLETTDYRKNATASRHAKAEVYAFIEKDLLDAQELLPEDFSSSNGERTQPNKAAAIALLARVYLYQENWPKAEESSSLVIGNELYALHTDLDKIFLANSSEAIWQLKPVVPGTNTPYGTLFILTSAPNATSRRVSLTNELRVAFEANDLRRNKWVGMFSNASGTWYFPYKYKVALNPVVTEYSMVLRLAEQYLIRAEARAHLENFDGALSDINVIRDRAGLEALNILDQPALLLAIEQERRVELFTEWGHRWLDLNRTGRSNDILAPIKSDWQTTDMLLPIPESERLLNPNLSQNLGYSY